MTRCMKVRVAEVSAVDLATASAEEERKVGEGGFETLIRTQQQSTNMSGREVEADIRPCPLELSQDLHGHNPENVSLDDGDASGPKPHQYMLLGNRSGVPMDEETYERMWRNIVKINPAAVSDVERVRNASDLPKVPIPKAPTSLPAYMSAVRKIRVIQNYMDRLQYNHTGMKLFDVQKQKTYAGLMETAKEMLAESLPIKCLEAAILGPYLTNCMPSVQRFAISFKTKLDGLTFRHIVLGLCHGGKFGSIGLSRRLTLQDKPMKFETLDDLVEEFCTSYKDCLHKVVHIRISSLLPHSEYCREQVAWKHVKFFVPPFGCKETMVTALRQFEREIHAKSSVTVATTEHQRRRA